MQSFISYLIEKRKHEDKFEELTPLEQLQKYAPHASNLYVSFTQVDKIGINPMSNYSTPNGIYTYQLDWLLKYFFKYYYNTQELVDVPFSRNAKFAWIIQPTTDVLVLNTYNNIDEDIRKLRNYFSEMSDNEFNNIIMKVKENTIIKNKAAQIWNITRILANGNPNRWNYLLRECLGYSIIRDDGLGLIHPAENYQTIFLSIKSFKVVDKIINKRSDAHLHINSSYKEIENKISASKYMNYLRKFEQFNELVDQLIKNESIDNLEKIYHELLLLNNYLIYGFNANLKINELKHGLNNNKLKKLIEISIKNKYKKLLQLLYHTPIGKQMINKELIS
jgi:hypothetical protein